MYLVYNFGRGFVKHCISVASPYLDQNNNNNVIIVIIINIIYNDFQINFSKTRFEKNNIVILCMFKHSDHTSLVEETELAFVLADLFVLRLCIVLFLFFWCRDWLWLMILSNSGPFQKSVF